MSFSANLRESAKDLLRGDASFLVAGLLVAVSGKADRQLNLSGAGRVFVRPKDSDYTVFRQVYRDRDYEVGLDVIDDRIVAAYEEVLATGSTPVIVDAGANIGAATRWFAQRFPKAEVIAIEPDPDNTRVLRRNIEDVPNARVIEAALGGEPGFVSLKNDTDESWGVQTVRGDTGLPIVTIRQAMDAIPNASLFGVKIDIEGFENDLFAGDTSWLDDARVVYIEPHDWMLPGEHSSRTFQREMGKRDFEIFLRGENLIYVR